MKISSNFKVVLGNMTERIKKQDAQKKKIIAISMISVLVLGAIGIGASVNSSAGSKEDSAKVAGNSPYAIAVNGKEIVTLSSESDANIVIDQVKNSYVTPGSEVKSVGFAEQVVVTPAGIGLKEEAEEQVILTTQEAITLIVTGSKEPKTYVVQGGDTVWDIAILNNLSPYELMQMNPGVEGDISIGQTLNLYQIKPYVTVKTKEVIVATEKIEYGINYEYTGNLYKGQSQVKSAGSYGSKVVTAEVDKENGVAVLTTPISESVTAEPVIQVNLVGTKSIPITTGTGQLGIPLTNLEISSAYGSRGGSRHLGVDLRMPRGSGIMAADGGSVIKAGYYGSYGNLIIINHGNGLETYYSHCNEINVSIGDQVTKGQLIGTVGSTGNATGSHLHFEVRLNGVAQNPMNYL